METWFQKVWKEQNPVTIDEMLMPDTTARGLGDQTRIGPGDFKGFYEALLELVSDVDIRIDHSMESGDWISALCTVRAMCRRTGKPAGMTGHVQMKIVDGHIVDAYNHFDFMGFYEQLGLLPEGSFARCLGGEKIA